jgi:hypothetical protein
VTVSPGHSATFKMTVSANTTLAGNVTFQCSGPPADATCAFNPASLSVEAGQSGSVALAITTQPATRAQTNSGKVFLFRRILACSSGPRRHTTSEAKPAPSSLRFRCCLAIRWLWRWWLRQ